VLLTGGNIADITGAAYLLAVTEQSRELIADKAYDTDDLRAFLQARGTLVVIPNKQRTIGRIKDFHAIATRYDKTARNFLAGIDLAAAILRCIN
jgi:transposase